MPKSFFMQKRQDGWVPFSQKDFDESQKYSQNEVVEFTPKKHKHSYRSLNQLRKYWVICTIVSQQMSDDPNFNTKEKCDLQAKVTLKFFDNDKTVEVQKKNGDFQVFFSPISIAVRNLDHINACFYFDRAFEFFAEVMNCTVEELMEMEVQK